MIQEPTSSVFVVTGIVAAILGPILGPLVLLLFAAVMGGLLAMSRTATTTRWEGFKFLMVGVGISFVLTGGVVWALEQFTSIPGNIAMMPVAFLLSAARGSMLTLIDKAVDALGSFFNAIAIRKGDGK